MRPELPRWLRPVPRAFERYALAIAAVAVVGVVRWVFDPVLGNQLAFTAFYFAVIVASWFGGLGPGLLAAVAGFTTAMYFFVEPRLTFEFPTEEIRFSALGYLVVSAAVAWLGGLLHAASRKQEALERQLNERLSAMVAGIADHVLGYDREWRCTYANDRAAAVMDCRPEDLVGRTFAELFPEQHDGAFEAELMRAVREKQAIRSQTYDPKGSRWYEHHIHPTAEGVTVLTSDITERKRAEVAQARLAAIVESSQDAIVSKTLDGVITSWNEGAAQLFGYSAHEVVGRSIFMLIPKERHDEERAILARLQRGERVEHFETQRLSKAGQLIEISLTVSPVRDADGRIVGASKVARDIGERRRADHLVRRTERLMQLILDNVPALISYIDLDFRYRWVNREYEKWFGHRPEEVQGRPLADVLGDHAWQRVQPYLDAAARGEEVSYEAQLPYRDGGTRWVHATYVPHADESGRVAGIMALVHDISALKEIESSLRDADRRKDEFLATLAHELRNPLAPVRNSLEIMKRADGNTELLDTARHTMDRQMRQMERLVEDLLDISRISRDKLDLRLQRVDLKELVQHAVESLRPLADERHHRVTTTLPAEPVHLLADPVRLTQVLGNLLNNAAKYTEPGGRIRLMVERLDTDVAITVADNGIGIAPAMLPHVFDMFTQAHPSGELGHAGLGIGLTLVKRLVELHGGRVSARSEGLGKGSEFVVQLPVLAETSEEKRTKEEDLGRDATSLRILVVDDNYDSAQSLALLLSIFGHEVKTAHDGEAAYHEAERFRPHVALLDIGLPKVDGHEVARRIREQPWGRELVLIAVTGWGQDDVRRRSTESGFDHHLVKPVDQAALRRLLATERPAAGQSA